jgi:O-antigen/teichoic acid export membrane protein
LTADADGRRRELKGLVVRGVGWMMASQASIQLLGFATSIVVARFLAPRDVGLAAEALVFSSLALVAVDFGFASVLVQRPQLSEEDKSTAFWMGTMLGVAMTLVGIGLSWPIASLYGQPEVQSLLAVLSFVFLFTAPGIVQGALLTRDLKFRSLEVRTIIATTVSCATAMALAVAGVGAWAIIAQHLTITSVSTLLLWRSSDWRPRAVFSMASLRGMARFTSHVFGTRVLAWGNANLDNFLVGRFLGPASLGAYALAFGVIVTPINRVATPITQVFFPAFSRMGDRERIAGAWLRAIRMVALVIVAPMLGLIAVAPDFVEVVFGTKWHAAIPVLQILAPVGLLQALMALNAGILQSLDRTRVLFRFTVVASIATVGAFAAGLPWGLEGVATAYLLATLVLQPTFLWLTTRTVGISPLDWLRSIAGVLQAGLGMLLGVLAARAALLETSLPVAARLAAVVLVGALIYVPLVAWRAPEVLQELRSLRARRREAAGPPAPEGAEAQV